MRHKKTKKRGGGWFDDLSQQATGYWSSASSSLSQYNPFKKTQSASTPTTTYTPTTSYTPTTTYGGKKRRTRHRRGGSRMTNFPLSPAPYQAGTSISYNLVGGKTRKHRKYHRKSRKH